MNPVILFIILLFLSAWLSKKAKTNTTEPGSLGDVNVPTADAGRVVPVGYGTCQYQSNNVVWYGDFGTTEIRKSGDDVDGPMGSCCSCGGMGAGDFTTVMGYRYYIGMDLGICCGPVDAFVGAFVGDKLIWSGNVTPDGNGKGFLRIDDVNFNGGDDGGGGIIADITMYFGTANQPVDPYLSEQTGCQTGYAGICHAVIPGRSRKSGYIGTSTYANPWKWVLRRIPTALGSGVANINGDANPMEILYDIYINKFYGFGLDPSYINVETWRAAAVVLAQEKLGMSIIFDSQISLEDFVNEIKRYINAAIYDDPADGRKCIKLIRNDYNPDTLPILDTSNISELKMTKVGWCETVNEVRVNYTERMISTDGKPAEFAFKTRTVGHQDIANYFLQNETINSNTIDLSALSNEAIARVQVLRSLTAISQPFAKVEIVTNRECYDLFPAALFKLTWAPYRFQDRVFRVVDIDYGELEDANITISALEDIYGVTEAKYGSVDTGGTGGDTGWTTVDTRPGRLPYAMLEEVPYISWRTQRVIVAIVARPNKFTDKYRVLARVDPNAAYEFTVENRNFMPCATLLDKYPANTEAIDEIGLRIRGISDCDSLRSITTEELLATGRNGMMIGGEMLAWRDVEILDNDTYLIKGVVRGIADTVPAEHAKNSLVWIVSLNPGLNSHDQPVGVNLVQNPAIFAINSSLIVPPQGILKTDMTFEVKLMPGSVSGFVGIDKMTDTSITTKSRAWRPLPPGRIRINNQAWPTQLQIGTDANSNEVPLTIAWAYREKLYQITRTQDDGNDTLEDGVTYNIDIYCNEVKKATLTGITDDHKILSLGDVQTIIGTPLSPVMPVLIRCEIYAVVTSSGLESWQRQSRIFLLTSFPPII